MNLNYILLGIFHRILARLIGLFFLIPLIYFYFQKKLKKIYKYLFLNFYLIVFQGFIGWYMVKSGLVNDITVSHYRLSIHLSTAFNYFINFLVN
jgi:cytochrome c oxidase assembly protein subunit 15